MMKEASAREPLGPGTGKGTFLVDVVASGLMLFVGCDTECIPYIFIFILMVYVVYEDFTFFVDFC